MKTGDFVYTIADVPVPGSIPIAPRSVGRVERVNGDFDVHFIARDKTVHCRPDQVEWFDPLKTGKPEGRGPPYPKKICNMCYQLKDQETEFQRNQNDKKGRITTRPSCNECRKEIDGVVMPENEKKQMIKVRPKNLDIFVCPLCRKTGIVGVTVKIAMDHSARTGKGREWICDSCNTGLGRFRDEISVLEVAITYLRKYP